MPSITAAEELFLRSPSCPIHPAIWFSSVLSSCPFLVASLSSSSAVVSRMTTRNAAGAYPTCPFLSFTSLQCSFSACVSLKMSVSHCCRNISFPRGLSGFLVWGGGGCHKRCTRTYLLPLFCPNTSLVQDTCDHLLCPNVFRSLMSILFLSCLRHSALCFCSFVFKSQSSNLLHHVFHHLPQPFHFFHQSRHLCAPLARRRKTLPSCFRPCLSTTLALELYPTTTVAAYQMPARCYISSIRCHRSSTSLEEKLISKLLRRRAQPNYILYL